MNDNELIDVEITMYDPDLNVLSHVEKLDMAENMLEYFLKALAGDIQIHLADGDTIGVLGTACIELLILGLREQIDTMRKESN